MVGGFLLRVGALCVVGIVLLAGLGVQREKPSTAVTLAEPARAVVWFDPADPPAEARLTGDERAKCRWDLRRRTSYAYTFDPAPAPHDGRATRGEFDVTFTRIDNALELSTTIYLPRDADARLIEHEEAHRDLAEAMYRRAGEDVRRIARELAGRRWTARGRDRERTAEAVGKRLLEAFERRVRDEVTGPMQTAQERLDELTDHGRNDVDPDATVQRLLRR